MWPTRRRVALARLLADIFSEEQMAVIQGDARTGAAFSALPFDHQVFTGSTAVGRAVMKAASAHTLASTFILNVTDDMKIMQEEIFGPVLPIKTYHSLDEAIAYVNSHPRPLALYYFGHDDDDRRKVLSRTTSGNVTINGSLTHYAQEDLPFGGVGPSGIGAYHGIEGFRALSHAKGVFEQGRWNGTDLLRAPFGRLADRILGLFLR